MSEIWIAFISVFLGMIVGLGSIELIFGGFLTENKERENDEEWVIVVLGGSLVLLFTLLFMSSISKIF